MISALLPMLLEMLRESGVIAAVLASVAAFLFRMLKIKVNDDKIRDVLDELAEGIAEGLEDGRLTGDEGLQILIDSADAALRHRLLANKHIIKVRGGEDISPLKKRAARVLAKAVVKRKDKVTGDDGHAFARLNEAARSLTDSLAKQ